MLGRKLFSSGLVLGLVVFSCIPARADLLKNFKTDGSIETRAFSIDNETDANSHADDYRGEVHTRVMLGGSFDLLDDVHGRVLLSKNNRLYGNADGAAAAPGATGASEDVNTVESNVFVDNAYVKIDKLFGHVDLTMGRQFFGDPNSLVIYFGPQNDDNLSITALDTFRADADVMGWAKFTGIAGKIGETSTNGTYAGNSDNNVWGGELNTDKLIPKGNLAAYYYTQQIKKAANVVTTGNNTLVVYGARAAGDVPPVAGLGYLAEIIQNAGRNNGIAAHTGYGGTAYDLAVKYGRDINAMPVRAHIEYARGSHDFTSIAPGRRFGIIWGQFTSLGAADISVGNSVGGAGITNLKVFDGGLGINPISKLGIDFNAYRFMYSATTSNKTSAGTEYDLILSWKHSDNVMLEVNAATFQVGDANQNAAPTPTNPEVELGADIKIKF